MIKWKKVAQPYGGDIERAILGKIALGQVGWNMTRSKGDGPETQYTAEIDLPGFKRDARKSTHPTLEAAKEYLARQVDEWMKAAGVRRDEGRGR